jgi:hypothetical protein
MTHLVKVKSGQVLDKEEISPSDKVGIFIALIKEGIR